MPKAEESTAERRVRGLSELCAEQGWALELERFCSAGYWSFRRDRGKSFICFQVSDEGRITIKFVREEDVAGQDWGTWQLALPPPESATNYYAVAQSRDPSASVRDLLPLLKKAWERLEEMP